MCGKQKRKVHLYRILVLDIPLNGETFECGEGEHVQCFVSAPPKLSITAIVKYLKGISGRKLFERFPEIRNQLWKGELWNHSYYVETVGSVSEENIRRYIEHQSKAY